MRSRTNVVLVRLLAALVLLYLVQLAVLAYVRIWPSAEITVPHSGERVWVLRGADMPGALFPGLGLVTVMVAEPAYVYTVKGNIVTRVQHECLADVWFEHPELLPKK